MRIKPGLDFEVLGRRAVERRLRFLEAPRLIRRFYGKDKETGDICGVYFCKDGATFAAYRVSDLAKSIPAGYEANKVRLEKSDVLFAPHPNRGAV